MEQTDWMFVAIPRIVNLYGSICERPPHQLGGQSCIIGCEEVISSTLGHP